MYPVHHGEAHITEANGVARVLDLTDLFEQQQLFNRSTYKPTMIQPAE